MELDAYECGMLDALLETLAVNGSLTTAQLYEVFSGDEDFALSLADILICEGLAGEAGYAQGSKMPLLLNLEKKGGAFLESGGFSACYHRSATKETVKILPRLRYFPAVFTSAFRLIFR
jgi:hypothetical protein